MIATGTDIKPIEIVMFMRTVKSRVLFEQMKGRGVRVIDPNELQAVTPDANAKTHFVIVDCVGVTETELADTQPLERKKRCRSRRSWSTSRWAARSDVLSSLASRLARLDKQCGDEERARVDEASGGVSLAAITRAIVDALDPDRQVERARQDAGLGGDAEPTRRADRSGRGGAGQGAVAPLATNPRFADR